ncbi:outer membrane immunogenic protein [Rhodoligotrophos appendicifer]|uniref:outer membrane protein n=1 Tax=Rhodoligotrophos appendicifer TaxID=987056 RepID=UPI001184FE8E|nr:outer membrane protein [Rhodoligotrophos appendicifer]
MKKIILASCLAAFGFTSAAVAADLSYPVEAPYVEAPIVPLAFVWTGIYIGGNVGYGWSDHDQNFPGCICEPPFDKGDYTFSPNGDGFLGGAQIGYNYQFFNNVVIGAEADFQWTDIEGTAKDSDAFGDYRYKSELEWFGTIRGRLGYAFDRVLVYGTGGAAYGKTKVSEKYEDDFDAGFDYGYSGSDTKWGWAAGAGLEYAFTDNLTAKVEYLYVDLGKSKYSGFYNGDFNEDPTVKHTAQTVRVGMNFKF